MPPKKHLPAPIDRPLSRAYLRQFTGWSTAYPPGASPPTSLRVMENVLINRESSVRVRPGLRHLSVMPSAGNPPLDPALKIVGTHEAFYLNDGRKAYLFAVRAASGRVQFRVGVTVGSLIHVTPLSDYFDITEWAAQPDAQPTFTGGTTYVKYLQIDNKILALSNNGEALIVFHVGATKKARKLAGIDWPKWNDPANTSRPGGAIPDIAWVNGPQVGFPTLAAVPLANSLWSNVANPYNYGFFYTYSNELGETEASNTWVAALSQPWGSWSWQPPLAGAGTDAPQPDNAVSPVTDPKKAAHQYVVALSVLATGTGFTQARDAGATRVNFYMFTWSNQDSVPVEAFLVGTKDITPASVLNDMHITLNPSSTSLGVTIPVPNAVNRYNSTHPSKAGSGLVASDRMVLVNDPTAAAVIRWTTNEQGNYLNFAPARGGGFKTLTSGNMQIPATVKLWQNPQSADTITILNKGTDGHSTSYYMAPAQVASQSDATNIMGFEETTATPGTTSPYGVEVANNALYHPLDDQLMKSTASNYNINHKSMTDMIANKWSPLLNKQRIVSCFFDQRIYYLVHNPEGAALETHCNGNEIWVMDLATEGAVWSRWLVQGVSLRKIEVDGRSRLSLVRPDGFFYFDPDYDRDDYVTGVPAVAQRFIPWKLETNTQGANRAHDAWAHLQQVGLTLGNFTGRLRWGVRGWDVNSKPVYIEKITKAGELTPDDGLPFDLEDQLKPARAMKEWFFFAESVETEGVTELSSGQITLAQYRYAPVSVNVGYEYGSVETFEYGRDVALVPTNTDNGVPTPGNDQRRM